MADAASDPALELARKEFEKWAKGPKLPLKRDRTLYAEYMTQLAWDAWKAALLRPHVCREFDTKWLVLYAKAREAMCSCNKTDTPELGPDYDYTCEWCGEHPEGDWDQVAAALSAAGLSWDEPFAALPGSGKK